MVVPSQPTHTCAGLYFPEDAAAVAKINKI